MKRYFCLFNVSLILFFGSLFFGLNAQIEPKYEQWKNDLNNDLNSFQIDQYYSSSSFVSYGEGALTETGDSAILMQIQHLKNLTGSIQSIEVQGTTKGQRGNIMSIAILKGSKDNFAVVTTWLAGSDGFLKEYEIIRPLQKDLPDVAAEIDAQRTKWETFSNDHDPAKLVSELCAMDVLYINGGKMISGQEALSQEYDYMSGEHWSITLTKAHVLPVNKQLVFEIGKYKSSGEGQYLLIWRKRYWDHKWVIEVDSNF